MTVNSQPLQVQDFSGGITDYYFDGATNEAKTLDNLLIKQNLKVRTRPGSVCHRDVAAPFGQFRIQAGFFFENTLFGIQGPMGFYDNGSGYSELEGPTLGNLFPSGSYDFGVSFSEWQGHVFLTHDEITNPQKIFKDNTNTFRVRNAGLPAIPAGVSIANPSGTGETYLYTFVFSYSYYVGTVLNLDRGPTYLYPAAVVGGAITGGNTVTITLPTTLTPTQNWDTANFKIEIYRTATGGDTFYKVGETTFGTASFIDNVPDTSLVNNEELYTTGGTVANDTPPACKFLHIVNDVGYYAVTKTGTEVDEYEVRMSHIGDPDSVPGSFFVRTEQKIQGLSSISDRPLVFCELYVYRIDGTFAPDGSGIVVPVRIDDKAGCVSNSSIVRTHKGIFWAGEDGFYWSDGFKVQLISKKLSKYTYKNIVRNTASREHIQGVYDSSEDIVYWAVSQATGNGDPDTIFALHLQFGISERSTFTTWSGGSNFRPTCLVYKDKDLYRGDSRGFFLRHNEDYFTDPIINFNTNPTTWDEQAIIHTYYSCFMDFGTKFVRKWVTRILVSASNDTNLSLDILSSNDNDRVTGTLQPIIFKDSIPWGASLPYWNDPSARWNDSGVIEEWRRFPARGLRCQYKQIGLTNAEVQLFNSDLLGVGNVDNTLKTVVLSGSSQWLDEMVGYSISFENDAYTKKYLVTSVTPTTIIFSDASNQAPSGVQKWIVTGKPKGEVLELNGYVIHWTMASDSHKPFSASSLGSAP